MPYGRPQLVVVRSSGAFSVIPATCRHLVRLAASAMADATLALNRGIEASDHIAVAFTRSSAKGCASMRVRRAAHRAGRATPHMHLAVYRAGGATRARSRRAGSRPGHRGPASLARRFASWSERDEPPRSALLRRAVRLRVELRDVADAPVTVPARPRGCADERVSHAANPVRRIRRGSARTGARSSRIRPLRPFVRGSFRPWQNREPFWRSTHAGRTWSRPAATPGRAPDSSERTPTETGIPRSREDSRAHGRSRVMRCALRRFSLPHGRPGRR